MGQTENEEKKRYLKSYQNAVRREKEILEEIERLRSSKMFPSLSLDGMPKSSKQTDLSEYAALLDKEIEKLRQERLMQIKLYSEIEDKILRMEYPTEQRILRLRYIQGLTWDMVAATTGYSWQHVHRIHSSALKNFQL